MKTMAGPLPIAEDIIALVEVLIAKLGPDAFNIDGRVQLYSGPRAVIAAALHFLARNQDRAFDQAARNSAALIDTSEIGKHLGQYDGVGIYEYFEQQYRATYGVDSPEAFAEADKVMRFASRSFIQAAFGHVATAVCGADTNRIFFADELPELVKNKEIETVNSLPAQMVRDFYAIDPYEAFRLICLSELLEARRYMKSATTPAERDKAKQDYKERLQFFMLERKETIKNLSTTPAHELLQFKLSKQRILASYNMADHLDAISKAAPVPPPVIIRPARGAHARLSI
jgi:hypothetical protein